MDYQAEPGNQDVAGLDVPSVFSPELLPRLAPVARYSVIEQLVGQVLGDRCWLEIGYGRVSVGAVK